MRDPSRRAIQKLLSVSRWRFWPYLAGTYLVGYAIGMRKPDDLLSLGFWLHLLYFTLPANLLLYGINDLCDEDTDAHNPKKGAQEHLLQVSDRAWLWRGVAASLVLTLGVAFFQRTGQERLWLGAFVVLAAVYSAPPLRLKARPFLDSASNVLYAVPGFLGFVQSSGGGVGWFAVVAAGLWTAAMHLFSAIPDIEADRASGVCTTATLLGRKPSLALCSGLWLSFAGWVATVDAYRPWSMALFLYPAIPLALMRMPPTTLQRAYWRFPAINGLIGMGAFFVVALQK